MPCDPVQTAGPSGGGSPINGLGIPFSVPVPPIGLPNGMPEDLLAILNQLSLLIPPGALQPALNPNFGKDIFDGIMKLLDQFMPFLMLYKFFLPVLNLIICIIEVLCALMNPFALISALNRLFTQCIPQFLNLFPIFALIIMIISLLLLLLALIEYIIEKILELILLLLRNVNALVIAFQTANATGIVAITNKLASLLCIFQNLFVLLAFFGIIVQIFKDILSMLFAIPPCEGGSNSQCCSPQFCPEIVQNPYTRTTGTLKYLNEVSAQLPGAQFFNADIRAESWQLYDQNQTVPQAFWNIVDGYDIPDTISPKPVFFPTDASYSATTSPQQAAYTVDLRVLYNPIDWGRTGHQQHIRFLNCIVLAAPLQTLSLFNGSTGPVLTGVFFLAGGQGFLDDGKTPLDGYAPDGITPLVGTFATLENFLHLPANFSSNPVVEPTDGYLFLDMEYTFKPNLPVLLQKNLITLGCEPAIAISRAFVNNVVFSNIAVQTSDLNNLVNSSTFPDPAGAQQCLLNAVATLRNNMTTEGVANFQTASTTCLNTLQTNTQNALTSMIGIGFSPCNSKFTLTPPIQFTTQSILVSVSLNENNGLPITQGLPAGTAAELATQITPFQTFGNISPFTYDGYQAFTANLTSQDPGSGSIMVAFQNQVLCVNTLPTDGTTPNHTLQSLDYQFVYAPSGGADDGQKPRRDAGDIARDSGWDNG